MNPIDYYKVDRDRYERLIQKTEELIKDARRKIRKYKKRLKKLNKSAAFSGHRKRTTGSTQRTKKRNAPDTKGKQDTPA